jgi:hypothetical protein
MSMGFPWGSYGISMVLCIIFLWDFFRVPMGFPCYFYRISMIFLLDFYDMSMGFLLDPCGVSTMFL